MKNATQFQSIPGFANFGSNTGTTTQYPWGQTTDYGYPTAGITPFGVLGTQPSWWGTPVVNTFERGLGFGLEGLLTGQGISTTVAHGQGLLQALFSETGVVLGPINGGVDSFFGNGFGSQQSTAVGSYLKLAQGVASAQTIAHTGLFGGQTVAVNGTTQGNVSAFLTSLIRIRYYDNNSNFVIGCEIPGGNNKNIAVNVVGDEIRITKTDGTQVSKNIVKASNFGNTGSYYSLPLPYSADAKAITATVKDGILTITLQKSKEISKNVHQINVK